jgi:GMP synthase (glutamine-hydrolysing)
MCPSVEIRVIDTRTDALDASQLDDVGAVVVSGSPHGVYEPHPWIAPAAELVRRAVVERSLPLLGVCFGHQLLAAAFGGEVARNPLGREMGTIDIELNDQASQDPVFAAMPRRFRAQATHRDTVLRPPSGARVLARSSRDHCQAFSVGERAWGVQFHPEITASILRDYVRARGAALRDEGIDPELLRASIAEEVEGTRVLSNFLSVAFGD